MAAAQPGAQQGANLQPAQGNLQQGVQQGNLLQPGAQQGQFLQQLQEIRQGMQQGGAQQGGMLQQNLNQVCLVFSFRSILFFVCFLASE